MVLATLGYGLGFENGGGWVRVASGGGCFRSTLSAQQQK